MTGMQRVRWRQRGFPNQKRGCGFPVLKLVVLFCLSSGALLARATGTLWESEARLLHRLLATLSRGDIVLGDRGFGNFVILALLAGVGADLLARVPTNSRRVDFRRGRRLGRGDGVVVWRKGPHQVDWNDGTRRVRRFHPVGAARQTSVAATPRPPRRSHHATPSPLNGERAGVRGEDVDHVTLHDKKTSPWPRQLRRARRDAPCLGRHSHSLRGRSRSISVRPDSIRAPPHSIRRDPKPLRRSPKPLRRHRNTLAMLHYRLPTPHYRLGVQN